MTSGSRADFLRHTVRRELLLDHISRERNQLRESHERLAAARDHYAALYEFAPVGYMTLSESGRVLDINRTGAQMLGHAREQLLRRPFIRFISDKDRGKVKNHLRLCAARKYCVSTDLELREPGARSPVQIELLGILSPAAKGRRRVEFKCAFLDISARKQAEDSLRESEERFRNLADSAPVMIWIADAAMQCTYFSNPWLEFTGRPIESEVGDGWLQGVHRNDRKRLRLVYSESFEAGTEFKVEFRMRRRDGEYRWVLNHGVPNFRASKEFAGFIGSCIDITERKQMESALDLAGRLPNENPSPVMRLRKGNILEFANPAAREVLEQWHSPSEGETPEEIRRIASRVLSANEKQLYDFAAGEKRYQACFAPVQDGGYVNIYFSDITERKEAEESLRKARDELEQKVRQRTEELSMANRELREEIKARGKMDLELRESEERFRVMIEGTKDYAFYMLDPGGKVATWNAGATQIIGYQASQVLGRHFSYFFSKEDVRSGKPEKLLKEARETGRAEYEGWRKRKDGSRFWASVIMTPLLYPDGTLRGFLKITRDTTERRHVQEELRQREKSLADFFDHSPFGLLWVTRGGLIKRVNRAGLELFGVAQDDCVLHDLREFVVGTGARTALKRLGRGEKLEEFSVRIRRRDGMLRHVLIDANGLWESGRMVYSRWFLRDVTTEVELQREVLVAAEKERQRIGRDLHDDLCQQLTGIEFLSQTLAGQLARESSDNSTRAKEIAAMIRDAITRTRELSHGLSPSELESRGLTGALQELAARTNRLSRARCKFQKALDGPRPSAAMAIQLYRIAQEAVANALRHGNPRRIDIRLKLGHAGLQLRVKDDGRGLRDPAGGRNGNGMGLQSMRYRAGVIGGSLKLQRSARGGTVVICNVGETNL